MNFLRLGCLKAPLLVKSSAYKPCFRSLGTVAENSIKIIFVDREGNRAALPARIGRTLLETAQMHNVDLEGSCEGGGGPPEVRRTENWIETTYGEGPTCFYCHVQIPSSFHHLLPPSSASEMEGIKQVWEEEANSTSRLACMITLEKKHDGMVVFVPDAPPVDLI
eukprot:CAMPEP_0170362480 /NCGR_PEP_ID=MMETSP0117_2-20130122/4354_1 /TAXON_ID=400756 /ORGANISM="Durinskia baltica, Strain CSIRO CS-38" /LENGTH=164 /DNA_ID=CAMNT_0010616899 /DNA_START=42 /DNA_END=536 /DNA_ORIENTATION=-